MSKQTSSKESAVRKKVDQKLVELGWIIDEDNPDCNVFTERAKTEEQNKKFLGNEPDYVLYESKTDRPIAIIETKRKGADLEKALKYAKNKYAKPLNINLVFATDSVFVKTHHLEENEELTINDEPIVDLISEPDMLKFAEDCFLIDNKLKKLDYTKDELIKIYKLSNDLLREDGLREGAERFTEFANILFLKYLSEMEEKNVKDGKGAKIDKNKRWDSIRAKHEDDVIDFINDTVFPHISKKYSDGENIFENKLLIKNGSILKKIINKLSEINLLDAESDVGGDAFEYFLKESVTVGNDLGEYFTPRHIIHLMIDMIDPIVGETVYDPACGTGGFLIAVFDKLKKIISADDKSSILKLQEKTLFGRELTNTYKIAKMNMILRGDGHNNIQQIDSLSKPILNEYKIALANIPYSQKTKYGNYYPIETNNADVVFIMHILESLENGGRACIIVPQGFLFRSGIEKMARKYLLENAEIKSIISLPSGVFKPYTGVSTAIIYFVKGNPTKRIWFYNMTSDGYTLDDKRKFIDGVGDIDDVKIRFKKFENVDKYCRLVGMDELKENAFSFHVPRYIDMSKHEEKIDIRECCIDLKKIYKNQEKLRKIVASDLKELGISF